MKTSMQNQPVKAGKRIAVLVIIGLTLSGLVCETKAGPRVPMCTLFDDTTGDGILSDTKGWYCDSEAEVDCGSAGGFVLNTDQTRAKTAALRRTLWMSIPGVLSGSVEVRLWLNSSNTEDGTCIDNDIPSGILLMQPGGSFFAGLIIDFTDNTGQRWMLRFGEAVCGNPYNTRCPVLVTAADLNGDGSTDTWRIDTIANAFGDSLGYLMKVNQKQQNTPIGIFSVPFGLTFRKE